MTSHLNPPNEPQLQSKNQATTTLKHSQQERIQGQKIEGKKNQCMTARRQSFSSQTSNSQRNYHHLRGKSSGSIMSQHFSGLPLSSEVTHYNADDDKVLFNQQSRCFRAPQQQSLVQGSRSGVSISAALESFYLSSNIKVLIGINSLPQGSEEDQNDTQCIAVNGAQDSIDLNYNGELYKTYGYHHIFWLPQQTLYDALLKNEVEQYNRTCQVTTVLTYGQKSTGKSELLGSLFESEHLSSSLIHSTLNQLLGDPSSEEDGDTKEVYMSCYEVFLETLTDLFDETNEEFVTENDATWLKIDSNQHAEQLLKTAFLNRKQIVNEEGLSFSQSHLIVNIKIEDSTQEDSGSMLSFIDLVGFDSLFTQKIMEGSSFSVNNISQFQRAEEEEGMNDQKLQELIADCNDNNLYSLRNLLLAIENDEEKSLQQAIEETTLARVVFAKMLKSANFYVVGTINEFQSCFNESLNTLEFCTKFQAALSIQKQEDSECLQLFTQGEANVMTTEETKIGLPQDISTYLHNKQPVGQDQMSRFYHNNTAIVNTNNNDFIQSNMINKNNNTCIQKALANGNVSANSTKMMASLDQFFHKKQKGQSGLELSSNYNVFPSRNNRIPMGQNPIKIYQDFQIQNCSSRLGLTNQNVSNTNLNKAKNGVSQKSTGFATNTQITHNRKFSQDMMARNNRGKGEKTFSELNMVEPDIRENGRAAQDKRPLNIDSFSRIQGKTQYDSSFMSTFLIQADSPKNKTGISQALQQFQQAKQIVSNYPRTNAQQMQLQASQSQNLCLQQHLKTPAQQDKQVQPNSMAQNFVFSMIKESLRSTQVQMDDFSNFFVKEKSAMEGCFTCSNSNSLAAGNNNFTDMFSKQKSKFFDVDKVLREIEQREIRQQTLTSIRGGHSSNQKNFSSIGMIPKPQMSIRGDPNNGSHAHQLSRGQSSSSFSKDSFKQPQILQKTTSRQKPYETQAKENIYLCSHQKRSASKNLNGGTRQKGANGDSRVLTQLMNTGSQSQVKQGMQLSKNYPSCTGL